jgi:DNA-binding GntR family transcriptional regulator
MSAKPCNAMDTPSDRWFWTIAQQCRHVKEISILRVCCEYAMVFRVPAPHAASSDAHAAEASASNGVRPSVVAPTTRAEQVFALIRVDILTGRLAPGQKLRFADLTDTYQASTTVIREGLTRLCELGLVVAHPQQGFQVTPLSVADLIDLTTARCDIEELALRYAVAHGDLRWESDLVAACHVLQRTGARLIAEHDDALAEVSLAWATARRDYHSALFAGCPNQRLVAFTATLRDAAELYRPWMPPLDRDVDPTLEHIACAEAALAGDADLAVALLRQHVQGMADRMIAGLSSVGPDASPTDSTS